MHSLNEYIDQFFSTAASALQRENEILEEHFAGCEKLFGIYQNVHHGIWVLYETTMVYLVFRKLLETRFPYEIRWEEPYPHQKQEKADLALKQEGNVKAYIEFKIWESPDAKEIKSDLRKMEPYLSGEIRGFIFVVWRENGDGCEKLNWLQKECNLYLSKPGHKYDFQTLCFQDGQKRKMKIILAFLEMQRKTKD